MLHLAFPFVESDVNSFYPTLQSEFLLMPNYNFASFSCGWLIFLFFFTVSGLMLSNKDAIKEKMHTEITDLGPIAPTKSIIPDSLDDDPYGDHVANHLISLSEKAEADQHSSDGACPMNSHGHLVAANELNKRIDDHLETSGSKDVFAQEEVGMASTGRLQECGEDILEYLPVCASPYKKVFSEEIREKSYMDECSVGINVNSKKRNETAVELTKGNILIETGPFYSLLGVE